MIQRSENELSDKPSHSYASTHIPGPPHLWAGCWPFHCWPVVASLCQWAMLRAWMGAHTGGRVSEINASTFLRPWCVHNPASMPAGGTHQGVCFPLAPRVPGKGGLQLPTAVMGSLTRYYWCFHPHFSLPWRRVFHLPNQLCALASMSLSGELNLRKHLMPW